MNRGAFERRFLRVEDAMRGLQFNRQVLLIRFATEEETYRLSELLDKQAKIKGSLIAKIAWEERAEIVALFETWTKRLEKSLNQE